MAEQYKRKKFSPRTLDLDLLFFDDLVCEKPAQLPRDEITKNAFVLWPLAEIASDFMHPTVNQTIGQIWQNYDKTKQKLWQVEM
jgi:2-amino-4-hydroxy-6-hydroxymethyldihydropteridine diphosphokinase